MNYESVYHKIIQHALADEVNRRDIYTESHHIIPQFMGGLDDRDNLVKLKKREHFICHVLLAKFVPKQFCYAAVKSCYMTLDWKYQRETSIFVKPGLSKRLLSGLKEGSMPQYIRDKISIATTNQFLDPEKRSRHLEGVTRRFEDPNEIEKLRIATNKRFEDQNERDKISIALKLYNQENGSHNKGRSFSHLTEEERKLTFGRKQQKGVKRSEKTSENMRAAWVIRKEKKLAKMSKAPTLERVA